MIYQRQPKNLVQILASRKVLVPLILPFCHQNYYFSSSIRTTSTQYT